MSVRLNPRTLLAASAITLALGNVGRVPSGVVGGRNAPIALNDLLLVPLWLFVFAIVARQRSTFKVDSTSAWSVVFIAFASLSTALAIDRYSLSAGDAFGVAAFLLRWVLYFGWYPLVVTCLDREQLHDVWKYFDHSILAIAVFGLFQIVFLPGFAQMIHAGGNGVPTWDVQGRRLVSTMLDPNFAGIVLVIALLMRIARVAEGMIEPRLPMLVLAVAVLFTVSRSALLAFAVGMGVIVLARGLSVRLVRMFLGAAILGLPFVTLFLAFASGFNKLRVDASAVQRLVPWIRALQLIRDNPILGVGFNAVPWAQLEHRWRTIGGADVSLDGGLLFVGAMTGIVGILVYVGILNSVVSRAKRVWRNDGGQPVDRAFATGVASATVAVVIHSFFVNSLLLPFVMQLLWVLWGGVAVLRRASKSATRVRVVAAPAMAVAMASLSACDPCAGVRGCSTAPRFDAIGTIVDATSGQAVSGVSVMATLPNGATASVTTNSEGGWRLTIDDVPTNLGGTTVSVRAPGSTGYIVRDYAFMPRTISGDAQNVGKWLSKATARFVASVSYHGKILDGASLSFKANPGVVANDIKGSAVSDGRGIFDLEIEAGPLAPLIGTLHVEHPSIPATDVTNFSIPVQYRYEVTGVNGNVDVAGQLSYGFFLTDRRTDASVPFAAVKFVRTGGVVTTYDTTYATTDKSGFFIIEFIPTSGSGDLVGDFIVKPPNAPETRIRDTHLSAYDSTNVRLYGVISFGERFRYVVQAFNRGPLTGIPNVSVQFRQTAGPTIAPNAFSGVTGADGKFPLYATSIADTGTVTGNLSVTFPGQSTITTTIKLHTNADDSAHVAAMYGVGDGWRWALELWRNDVLKPAPGIPVEFRQTGGVQITPSVIRATTGADGRIEVRAAIKDTGTVIGQLVVSPPGEPQRIIPNISLHTYASDSLRFGGVYGYGPALHYAGEVLLANGTPVVGATVEWTQTSGIAASPSVLRVTTDATGRFPLQLVPSRDGEVVGTVRVMPPAPYAAGTVYTFTNLRINTFESGDLRLAVTYRIPPP